LVSFNTVVFEPAQAISKATTSLHDLNKIALEKSKAIGRLNELEKSLKTKLHRLRDKNEEIMTDELVKIKDINSQAFSLTTDS
jgi:hypothetical protein